MITIAFFKEVQINLQADVKNVSNRRIIIVHYSIMIKTIKDNTVSRLAKGKFWVQFASAIRFDFHFFSLVTRTHHKTVETQNYQIARFIFPC